jgi:hypothetical protein
MRPLSAAISRRSGDVVVMWSRRRTTEWQIPFVAVAMPPGVPLPWTRTTSSTSFKVVSEPSAEELPACFIRIDISTSVCDKTSPDEFLTSIRRQERQVSWVRSMQILEWNVARMRRVCRSGMEMEGGVSFERS